MDLNRASIFLRVVDRQGFTAAGRAVGLPKSSVSRAVALLEDELGVRLLQRSTRRLRLTEAGEAFYERASRGMAELDQAAAAVTEMQGALRGPIRITAPVDIGVWLLQPVISRFVQEHSGVQVDVALTPRLVDMVHEGFDLALRAGRLRDTSLVARNLPAWNMELYASQDYLRRRGTPHKVADLAKHECVLFRPVRGTTTWVLSGPKGDESVEVSGQIGADDFVFLRGAVLSGAGIGLLPSFLCRTERKPGRLVRVMPSHVRHGDPLHLVYPSARLVPRRVAALRDALLEVLGAPAAGPSRPRPPGKG